MSLAAPTARVALVVGDGTPATEAARILAEESWQVVRLASAAPEASVARLREASVVILDATGVSEPAPAVLERLGNIPPETATILLAGPDTPRQDFAGPGRPRLIQVPVRRESLLTGLDAEIGYRSLLRENRLLRQELRTATRLEDWVGCSDESAEIRSAITTTAFSEGPVLIVGEPGSGRRLAAELVHRLGRQSALPFLPLQAASLPEGELGTILARLRRIDAEPGSDVLTTRPGSVYLSGIDRLRSRDQAILGDAVRRPPSFRLLVSGPPDLTGKARAGNFCRTLLKRLENATIRIPPLRQRREDIPGLLLHFLNEAREGSEEAPFGISGATVEACGGYPWPGNTGELRTWVQHAVATARVSRFSGSVLPEAVCAPPDGVAPRVDSAGSRPLKEVLAEIEKALIERALRRTRGNQKRAAQALQMNPTTLHEKMKRHGLLRRSKAPELLASARPAV